MARHCINRRKRTPRRGAAAVELALCLPVLAFVVLATIEACNLIFLQQSITVAAYEGARTALVRGATKANAEAHAEQVLADREVRGAKVQIVPGNFNGLHAGDYVRVRITADFDQNRFLPSWILGDRTLTAEVHMMYEYDNDL